jgi:hypothetical protein
MVREYSIEILACIHIIYLPSAYVVILLLAGLMVLGVSEVLSDDRLGLWV